ncbi:MAG: UDP-N-acetylglucosamine--N-acetylmuramyl-(pentapeptide) pyrophosphoryl-undecaprenol N-acetylglucosamine transferase [Anaerolineales bacterium]|nr:UDP-N-acetylglucosamine--N-acetylmuramyl-(pentapeptide) pyrophosphoryl-undecaprenol N-acetylglucosamine transferase [Anaerolineales bacterium]
MEVDLVKRAGLPFEAISAAGVHGVGPRALPGNLWRLARGYGQARRILRRFQPDVLFFTGGFVAVPMALAGRRIPSLLYVPDIEPGLALKALARFADCVAVTAQESRAYFPKQADVRVTGYPARLDLNWSLEAARRVLGLSADLPVLLVFGGSRGARSINRALLGALPDLLNEMQVIHISGWLDWERVEAARSALAARSAQDAALLERYRAFPYLHDEMGAAFTVADLALSRAGASTLGEFPLCGLPAILVPYPHAWRYQRVNADYLAEKGAALVIEDAQLPERILPLVRDLMRDSERRQQMRQAMQSLARPSAAGSISELLWSLAAGRNRERI